MQKEKKTVKQEKIKEEPKEIESELINFKEIGNLPCKKKV